MEKLYYLGAAVLITVALYLLGAFVCAGFDSTEWHPFARFTIALLWFVFIGGLVAALYGEGIEL